MTSRPFDLEAFIWSALNVENKDARYALLKVVRNTETRYLVLVEETLSLDGSVLQYELEFLATFYKEGFLLEVLLPLETVDSSKQNNVGSVLLANDCNSDYARVSRVKIDLEDGSGSLVAVMSLLVKDQISEEKMLREIRCNFPVFIHELWTDYKQFMPKTTDAGETWEPPVKSEEVVYLH